MIKLIPIFLILLFSQGQSPLVSALVEALNQGDEAHLTAFAQKWCSNSIPPADRAKRLMGIAQQGAPFKIVRVTPAKQSIMAVLEDKNGEQIGFKIELTPEGKYDRAMAGPPEGLNSPPPKDYRGWKSLQSLTDNLRKDTQNPAMGIAVLRAGKLEEAVSGTRSAKGTAKVGIDEPWSIGSIGKPLCSTVIGKLIEMGKLRWNTTLGEAFKGVPMKPGYKNVTIEQIMHHRGGIPADPGMRQPQVQRIVNGATDKRKIRDNYARDILSRDLAATPGTTFIYSNAGYALLGVIAERAAGKPYERLVRDYIFMPLHLSHSYTSDDKLPAARPSGHIRNPQGLEEVNFGGPLEILFAPAGGGMFMSLADLAHFGQAHLDGLKGKDGLLKAATIKRLHLGIGEGGPNGRQYACGWGIEKFPGIPAMHTHNGSNGTMRAQLAIFPDRNMVVASFVNAGGESEPSPPLQAVLAVARK